MKSEIELINEVVEFNEIHKFMDDEQIDRALTIVVKAINGPGDLPPQAIPNLIVELQALSAKCAILATYYNGIGKGGPEEIKKKNMYYTFKEVLNDLVNALKYQAKGVYYGG